MQAIKKTDRRSAGDDVARVLGPVEHRRDVGEEVAGHALLVLLEVGLGRLGQHHLTVRAYKVMAYI